MNGTTIRRCFASASFLATLIHGVAFAADPGQSSVAASEASGASVVAVGSAVVVGSLATMALAGSAVVASVETVGDVSVVVLRGVSDASDVTLRIAGGVSVVAGSIVEVVALGTGCALMTAGRMVAFIPNQIGRALVHQRPLAALRRGEPR